MKFVYVAAAKFQDWFYRNIWAPEESRNGSVSLENPYYPINGTTLDQALGGNVSTSGRSISYDGSLTLSAVWRAISIKSGIISMLPFQVYKKTGKGRVLVGSNDHPVAKMFARKPNNKMTKVIYLDRAMQHYEGWGNHIGLITRSGVGQAEKIDLVHPKEVQAFEGNDGITYKIKGIESPVNSDRVLHVPNLGEGIWGKSVLGKAREDLSLQMDTRDYGAGIYAKGGVPVGLFVPQAKVTNDQRTEMQNAWKEAKTKNRAVAMPFGWNWQSISLPPEDMAMMATAQFGITTVARWFGVPPEKLADMGRATYNNIEHNGISFLQDTMNPIAKKYEAEYTTKLFPLTGEEDMYAEFNMDAYLRADSVAKAEALTKLVQNGLRTPNEGREIDNYEEMPEGNDLFMQSGTVPIRMIAQMMAGKPAAQRQSLKKKIEKQLNEGIDPQLIIEGIFNSNGNGKH